MDAAGNLYIADTGNQRIRRVDTTGVITTVAGNGKAGYNGDGSPATAYWLNGPAGVAAASGCTVGIADTLNQSIRQLTPPVNYTITSIPSGLQVSIDGQTAATPVTVQLLPGTTHTVSAPSPQSGSAGTQYIAPGAQSINVSCGAGAGFPHGEFHRPVRAYGRRRRWWNGFARGPGFKTPAAA